MAFLFGPKLTPKDYIKKWKRDIGKEQRVLERQIAAIKTEQKKCEKEIKAAAKSGNLKVAKIMAMELVRSRKAVERLHTSKAQMNSVVMQMDAQAAMLKVMGAFKTSTEVMRAMSNLVRVPQIQAAMQAMSQEMVKAGIIEEMVSDTMDMAIGDDVEDEADEAVDKVLNEIISAIPNAAAGRVGPEPAVADTEEVADAEGDAADAELRARLAALNA